MRRVGRKFSVLDTCAFALFLTVAILTGAGQGRADEKRQSSATLTPLFPNQMVLDGTAYTNKELLSAFVDITLSPFIRANHFPDPLRLPPTEACTKPIYSHSEQNICGTPAEYKTRYPWLYDFLYREKGEPKYFAVNKWTGPIRISLGYPADLAPVLSPDERKSEQPHPNNKRWLDPLSPIYFIAKRLGFTYPTRLSLYDSRDLMETSPAYVNIASLQTTVEDEITVLLPVIRDLTGLPVSYIEREHETAESTANLRIIFQTRLTDEPLKANLTVPAGKRTSIMPSGLRTSIPGDTSGGVAIIGEQNSIDYRRAVEPALLTAVHFTSYTDQQVDGYLLPNADNSIGMSFCFIGANRLEPPILRALVRECLVRSLGLPNAPSLLPTMLLGLWNGQLPGESRALIWMNRPGALKDAPTSYSAKEWGPSTPPITEFDRFIIRTLYNSQIRPGMTLTDIYHLASRT